MALFFDKVWFDARLEAAHLTHADLGNVLGLNPSQIAEIWKDQRELSAKDVLLLASLLDVPAAEISNRAGISTPLPREADDPAKTIRALSERLDRVERTLAELKDMIAKAKP